MFGYVDIVQLLIDKGASLNLTDNDGYTALDYGMLNSLIILIVSYNIL